MYHANEPKKLFVVTCDDDIIGVFTDVNDAVFRMKDYEWPGMADRPHDDENAEHIKMHIQLETPELLLLQNRNTMHFHELFHIWG